MVEVILKPVCLHTIAYCTAQVNKYTLDSLADINSIVCPLGFNMKL